MGEAFPAASVSAILRQGYKMKLNDKQEGLLKTEELLDEDDDDDLVSSVQDFQIAQGDALAVFVKDVDKRGNVYLGLTPEGAQEVAMRATSLDLGSMATTEFLPALGALFQLRTNYAIKQHEDRGDFSVASASRAKLVITPDDPGAGKASPLSLVVQLDEANGGAFADCAAFSLPPALNAGWLSRAYLGVSASTGQLADNHDVLELEAFSSQTAHVEAEAAEAEEKYFEPGEGVSPERFDRIETQLDALVAQLEHLQHHLEHEMVAVDDHVRATIDKLAKQEEASEQRIDALEAKVVSNVEDSLTQRIATLEQAMRDAVQKRISTVENRYMSKLGDVVSDKIDNAGRGWTWPFLFLIVVDVIAFVLVRNWYVKFKKSHLL